MPHARRRAFFVSDYEHAEELRSTGYEVVDTEEGVNEDGLFPAA